MIAVICLSCVFLGLESPLNNPNSITAKAAFYGGMICGAIFTVECFLKSIVWGFAWNGKTSYMRDGWHFLDFIIAFASWLQVLNYFDSGLDYRFGLLIRTIRATRSLRLISKNEGLKLAIRSILSAMPAILQLTVVCMIFFLLYGIFGVTYFRGAFWYCDTANMGGEEVDHSIHTKWDCMDWGGDWVNNQSNFDNIGKSYNNLVPNLHSRRLGVLDVQWHRCCGY